MSSELRRSLGPFQSCHVTYSKVANVAAADQQEALQYQFHLKDH